MMRLACFSKTEKKSFPDVNADIDNFKLQNLFFLHNICVIIMILWWYFSSVWSFCSRPTDAIWQENQCFFLLSGFGLDYGVIGGEDSKHLADLFRSMTTHQDDW